MASFRSYILAAGGVLCAAVLPSCSAKSCDDVAAWSFRIHVRDSVTNEPICDATLTATKGTAETALSCIEAPYCFCVGVAEELGSFQVSVTKSDYQPAMTTVVVDQDNGCHVITKDATVSLVPE